MDLGGTRRHYLLAVAMVIVLVTVIVYLLQPMPPEEAPPPLSQPEPLTGEFLTWQEVDQLFPRNAYADVVDYETGLTFRVQRRAGSYHADVQPLTAEDTAVMKKIYSGKWAWTRRSVLVVLDSGRVVAASMNGMPHGSGAIKDNKFNGHFCIHFRDSITHGSRSRDTAHQVMIWKAAGVLKEQLGLLKPEEVFDVAMAALAQRDYRILREVTCGGQQEQLLQGMADITWVKPQSLQKLDEQHFSAQVQLLRRGSTRTQAHTLRIEIVASPEHWCVSAASLLPLIEP